MSDIITLDGPASSGKSSVGFLFSQKINYQFVDTGAIYRAGCLEILNNFVPLDDEEKQIEIFNNLKIDFRVEDNKPKIYLFNLDVTDQLHHKDVTAIVPIIAANPKIREISKALQRQVAWRKNTVMTGRDIGTEIFPEARLKFFLTASVEVRAKRRFEQLKLQNPLITFEQVLENTKDRDYKDTHREASPMRISTDAIVIDTSNKTIEESVDEMLSHYQKLPSL